VVKQYAPTLPINDEEMIEGKNTDIILPNKSLTSSASDNPLEHMIRLVKEVTVAGKMGNLRAGFAQFSGQLQLWRRHGQAGCGQHERRRKSPTCPLYDRRQRPGLLLLDEPTNHLDWPRARL
jgi:ATP-binding cassette subfamily F protein 3